MLAAMPPTPTTPPNRGEPRIRERSDACPGALRLHPADDGHLARLRLPGGLLTSHQLTTLARAAEELGDGMLSVTSRGNVELRGLGEECGAQLADFLRDAGLLPSDTHERVRNVVSSPLAGLDGLGCGTVQLWARQLDALLCASGRAARLSGRFLFALDDGRGDVAGLGADVTLLAADGGSAVVHVGAQAFRIAAGDAPRAALAAAEAFLTAAEDSGTGAWRVRELPAGQAPAVGAQLEAAGIAATRVRADAGERTDPTGAATDGPRAAGAGTEHGSGPGAGPGPQGAGPRPGLVEGPGRWAVSVAAPLGRLTAAQARALLPAPSDEVRLTPWRGVVVPGFTDPDEARARLRALDEAGLITGTGSPWYGVGACTGRPGCGKAFADVRADAATGRDRPGEDAPPTGPDPTGPQPSDSPPQALLPVYFSGCERRCGHPHGEHVDALALPDGTYRVTAGGASVAVATTARLADAVAAARRSTSTTTPTK
ncbi:cobalamin biosynthesis protein CobG [Streptomyces sp. NPDC059175]|uniref:cobalamin biosynthesis protein CobG n=1 Tax=Streptomyces sp. NPDC059175 TaxID=3346757 RepID=UPI0036AC39B3